MRGNLEAHLMYSTPSELLVADPMSKASRRLLGSFSQAVQGLKAESLPKEKYGREEAHKAVLDFYVSGALLLCFCDTELPRLAAASGRRLLHLPSAAAKMFSL